LSRMRTMASAELLILDVGHGNCSVLADGKYVTVFDAPPGVTLTHLLATRKIRQVQNVVVSHADEDHIGGIIQLLCDDRVGVKRIYVNADAIKRTEAWKDFRVAVGKKRKTGLDIQLGVTTQTI